MALAGALLLLAYGVVGGAHTLCIKPSSLYLPLDEDVIIPLFNGTFVLSENKVAIRRLDGVAIVTPGGETHVPGEEQWYHDGGVTTLKARFSETGNYVIGLGTRPMQARIEPENFNFYLRYEGLDDDAQERQDLHETEFGAAERYSKFAKAIVQVGDRPSDNFSARLGHPVEIVPLKNPYTLELGNAFTAQVLLNGEPLAGELIYATHEGFYEQSEEGIYQELVRLRSDDNGMIEFPISASGRWYVRFIHLTRLGDREAWYSDFLVWLGVEDRRIPYRSLWATLTFEIR